MKSTPERTPTGLSIFPAEKKNRRPKLCMLTQYFPPEMGAPQVRLSELGERLIDRGWDVEALTALPNYPTGAVYPGYDTTQPSVASVGRIRAVRVPLFTAKHGVLNRLRSYFSFVRSAKRFGPQLCNRPDLLFVESPPLFIAYAARYLARKWNCPYVFNASDLWPESLVHVGLIKPGFATKLAERLELSTYRRAAAVTGQSEEIIASVERRCKGVKTHVVTNGVTPARFGADQADASAREMIGLEPGPVYLFAGLMGVSQGLDQILDLAKQLPRNAAGRFVLVGDGPVREHLAQRIHAEHIERVRLVPAQPRSRVPALLAAADVAIVSLGMTIPGAVPSKIYEAMASSLPILLVANGEPADRVTRAECGLVVPPGNSEALMKACLRLNSSPKLRHQLGAAGRVAAESTYNREHIAAKLDVFLRELLPTHATHIEAMQTT